MKTKIILYFLLIILLFSNQLINLKAKEKKEVKHFACKLITLEGKIYQTLLLGFDWKEVNNEIPMHTIKNKINDNDIIITTIFSSNQLKLNIQAKYNGEITYYLTTINGTVLKKHIYRFIKGFSVDIFDLSNLAKGYYLLNINDNKKHIKTVKIVNF